MAFNYMTTPPGEFREACLRSISENLRSKKERVITIVFCPNCNRGIAYDASKKYKEYLCTGHSGRGCGKVFDLMDKNLKREQRIVNCTRNMYDFHLDQHIEDEE